MPQLGGPAD